MTLLNAGMLEGKGDLAGEQRPRTIHSDQTFDMSEILVRY